MNTFLWRPLAMLVPAVLMTACAVRPVADPRNPGMPRDVPVTLRVCIVDGDGAHLSVGDQVEFSTDRIGGLRIRHVPGQGNQSGAWNGGDDVTVRTAVLVELVEPQAGKINTQRFVPVGRFPVRVTGGGDEHVRFDFLVSKTIVPTRNHPFSECNADVGDDEVLIRGVEDDSERHGGTAILR
ncbi:MAG TPA: hypothetical protein VGC50_05040 [Gammaproteobacteria bacterium]|jgi:hypothetical protein